MSKKGKPRVVKLRFTHFPPFIRGRNIEFMSNLQEIKANLDIIVELIEETRWLSVTSENRQLLKEIEKLLEKQYFFYLSRKMSAEYCESLGVEYHPF